MHAGGLWVVTRGGYCIREHVGEVPVEVELASFNCHNLCGISLGLAPFDGNWSVCLFSLHPSEILG